MKNIFITLILLYLTCASSKCQEAPRRPVPDLGTFTQLNRIPKDYPVEPQWYPQSCWAATLSMASKYIARDSTQMNQCYFVDQGSLQTHGNSYCGCQTNPSNEVISLSRTPCDGLHNTCRSDNLHLRFSLAQSMNSNAKKMTGPIDLNFLHATLKKGNPVIHAYKFQENEDPSRHVYLISGIENPKWKRLNKSFSTNLLLVKDPWPEAEGSEYYVTFEQFHLHNEPENIFFDENLPGPFPQSETVTYMKNIFHTSDAPSALSAVRRYVANLKKMDPTSVSTHFLKKSGIRSSIANISVYPREIPVEEINSNELTEIPLTDSDTLRSFGNTDIMFFLVHNGIAKSVITASKRNSILGESTGFINKWFISRLEKADRYQEAFDFLLASEPHTLAILRYKGSTSGEVLAKQSTIKGKYIKIKVLSRKFNVEAKNRD